MTADPAPGPVKKAWRRNGAAFAAACLLVLTVLLAVDSLAGLVPGQAWLARNSEAWVMAALFLLDREVVCGTLRQARSWAWIGVLAVGTVATVALEQTVPNAFATQRESFAAVLVLAAHFRFTASWRGQRPDRLFVVTIVVVTTLAALLLAVASYPTVVGSGVADAVTDYAEAFMFVPLAVAMYDLVYGWKGSVAPLGVRVAWLAGLVAVPLWVAVMPTPSTSGPAAFWARTTEALLAIVILSVWFALADRMTSDSWRNH